MKPRTRTTLAATGAALALAAGGGGALAAGGGGGEPGPGPGPGGRAGSAVVAAYLGLSSDELRTQLGSGKTLAEIAAAQGKPVAGLEDAIVADAKTRLDQAVADGKLTAAQEKTMLENLQSHLDDIVDHTGTHPGHRPAGKGGPHFAAAAAAYLGLTQAELRTQLKAGKSLTQVATAQGKPVDGLEAAILAAAKTRLDKAVADGRLTAAQENTMLENLQSHLDEIVNRTGTAGPRGPHGPGGHPPDRGRP
jgi:hypothetical protein